MSRKNFKWYYEKDYKWNKILYKKGIRGVYQGENNNSNEGVISKLIKIDKENNKPKFEDLLKEVYFLAAFKKNDYFNEIIDVFLSQNDENVNIVLKDEGINLKDLIEYNDFDYESRYPHVSRWIIFRVTCGLYDLHKLGLSHNDIKLSNITLSNYGTSKICDFGSIDKIEKGSNVGTSGYYSPQNLLGKGKSKEDDMWAIGVVFLELLKRKPKMFSYSKNYQSTTINAQHECELKDILRYNYNIYINGQKKENDTPITLNTIIQFIKNNNYNAFKVELKDELLQGINDNDKIIIKRLLEFDPEKRMTSEELIKHELFKNYKYEKKPINYKEGDYNNYLENVNDFNIFKRNLELIREKLIMT